MGVCVGEDFRSRRGRRKRRFLLRGKKKAAKSLSEKEARDQSEEGIMGKDNGGKQ